MIRTVWFFVNALFWTIRYGVPLTIAGVIGVPNKEDGIYERGARGFCRKLLWASGVKYSVAGVEKIPDQPVVFVANHQSWFDIFLAGACIPGRVRFVAKKELRKVPFFGSALAAAGHILIDRKNRQAALGAYQEAAASIRGGLSAVVFAEGTRSRDGELLPFKKGPFVLAIAAGVPVVPVYCAGTFDIMQKGSATIRPQPIALLFGDPVETAGLDYKDRGILLERARKAIEQLRVDSQAVLG